jgi:hypothetical protein
MIGSLHQKPPPQETVPGAAVFHGAVRAPHGYFMFMSLIFMSLGIVDGIVVAGLSLFIESIEPLSPCCLHPPTTVNSDNASERTRH